MTPQQMRDALERATELAPPSEVDPDAIWLDARRANRNSRLLLVVASLVIGVMAGGLVWRGADFTQSLQPARPVAPPPSYEESMLAFPDGLWSIPAGMPTTAEEGPIGPLVNPEDDPREGGPSLGDERATLMEFLRCQRLTLELKCSGLDSTDLARRSVEPSTMSLLGLVRHMAEVERGWLRQGWPGWMCRDTSLQAPIAMESSTARWLIPRLSRRRGRCGGLKSRFTDRLVAEASDLDVTGKRPRARTVLAA